MATTIALQEHDFWEQFDPVPTEVIKVELVPYDEKWWRALRTGRSFLTGLFLLIPV